MMTIMNDTTTNQQQNQRGGGGSVVVEVIRIMIGIETIILHVVEEKLSFTKYQQQQQFPVTEVEVNRKVAQQASHTKSSKIKHNHLVTIIIIRMVLKNTEGYIRQVHSTVQ